MDERSVKERLAEIETKIDILIGGFANHLKHHWAVTMILVTALAGITVKWLCF